MPATRTRTTRTWTTRTWTGTAAGLLAAGALAGCTGTGPASLPSATTSATASAIASATSAAEPATTVTSPATTIAGTGGTTAAASRPAASATAQLAAFLAAADRADGALRGAAAAINANLKSSPGRATAATDQAFRRAEGAALTAKQAIPIGLDDQLLLPVLTVQSGITARLESLRAYPRAFDPRLTTDERADALRCLGRGAPAAHRAASDLAHLRDVAAAHPPVRLQLWTGRAGVVLAVQLEYVQILNSCSDTCGGEVMTRLVPVRVTSLPERAGTAAGTYGDIRFTAHTFEGTWFVSLEIC